MESENAVQIFFKLFCYPLHCSLLPSFVIITMLSDALYYIKIIVALLLTYALLLCTLWCIRRVSPPLFFFRIEIT
jgi:hypothetical protein